MTTRKRSSRGRRVAAIGGALALGVILAVTLLSQYAVDPKPAAAVTAVLGSSKDNTLYSDSGSVSNGAGSYFFTGRTGQALLRRGVISFDIAGGIPAGSTITSVSLTLSMSRTIAPTQTVALHSLLADWGEGTSNANANEGFGDAATTGDATWSHRFYNTVLWSAAGGDFSSSASASQSVGGVGFYTWSSAQMVTDVQGWLDSPSTNYGWLLSGNEAVNTTAKRFDTKEIGTPANRPALTIEYTVPPTVTPTPTITGTPTNTPTITPTWTPKNPVADTDGDTVVNSDDLDDDNDGCTDVREEGPNPQLGGGRNPHVFWDFFDVPTPLSYTRDKAVVVGDIAAIVARFGSSRPGGAPDKATAFAEALTAPPLPPAYHAAYDQTVAGVLSGPPDGAVTVVDINRAVVQFGANCL